MQPQKRNKPIIIQLLITIAFYIILYAVLYSIKPEKVFLYSVEDIVDSANHPLKWLRLIVFLHFIVLLVWSSILVVKMYRKHKEEIASQFSYREKISLSWLPYLLALIILNGVGTIFDSLLSGFDSYLFIISNFLYCTFYLVYAFLGVSQQDIVYNEPETTDAPENNSEEKLSSIPANIRKQLVKELKALMEEQKIYLNSELRLDFVVKELRTNRTYVSMVLKEDFGENFIGFVNRYRIEEAKQLMSKADNLSSLYEIAEEVGFKSISSFNVFFKRFTDETPAEFRKKRFREFNLIVEESIG